MDWPVVFYDGECGLCDGLVQRLIRLDRSGRLHYATLQGETARRMLGTKASEATMRYLDERGLHDRSTAALRAVARTGGLASFAALLLAVPRPGRDALYRWVARNRYRWFGRAETCRVPDPALRERFLP